MTKVVITKKLIKMKGFVIDCYYWAPIAGVSYKRREEEEEEEKKSDGRKGEEACLTRWLLSPGKPKRASSTHIHKSHSQIRQLIYISS